MEAEYMIAVYVGIDDWYQATVGEVKYKPKMTPSEVMWVAVMAAKYFQNHLERALQVLCASGYIPAERCLSISRFNRQLHQCRDLLAACLEWLMGLASDSKKYITDTQPLPVCKRVRARRCRKVRGRAFCGYCAAKKERYFGWKLHLVTRLDGCPVAYTLVPAAYHDLTGIYEITYGLPDDATVFGDKAYNCRADEQVLSDLGTRLLPRRRKNMKAQHTPEAEAELRQARPRIETVNSQSTSMGLDRLRAYQRRLFSQGCRLALRSLRRFFRLILN